MELRTKLFTNRPTDLITNAMKMIGLSLTDDKETSRTEWMSGVLSYTQHFHTEIISSWTLEPLKVP
jgi:hypothetical protein